LFLPILLWVVAALRWEQKKAKKENDKIRAEEEMKEKRFNELKDELREQTKTQKRLVRLFELRTLIKTAMMTKNKKLLKDAIDEMAKFLGTSDSSPTDDADADDDDDDDEFPLTILRAGV
jgi:cell division protein FtsB